MGHTREHELEGERERGQMNSKRPVDKGSSPATRKKARRSIMKTGTMASGVRGDENISDDTNKVDFKTARKSRVSFGRNMVQEFKRDESASDSGSINATVTTTAPVIRREENKENDTLDMFDLSVN